MVRAFIIAVIVGLAVTAAPSFGYLGQIVSSFPAPENYPIALAVPTVWNEFLWVFCNSGRYRIYRISGATGSVLWSFISTQGRYTRGLTYSFGGGAGLPSGSWLWMGNYYSDYIYRHYYNHPYVTASFPARHDMYGGLAVGATADGGYQPIFMLSSDESPQCIYRQSLTNGAIYHSFAPSAACYDLAWDWRNKLIWTGYTGNRVYGFSTTGSLRASFTLPAYFPLGFCYTAQYLWVSTTSNHYIYRTHCPYPLNVSVEPASMGRIKASYR